MAKSAHFTLNRIFRWKNATFMVKRRFDDNRVVIENIAFRDTHTFTLGELERALFKGELEFEAVGKAGTLKTKDSFATPKFIAPNEIPAHSLRRAELRLEVIRPLVEQNNNRTELEAIRARIEDVQSAFSPSDIEALGCKLSRASIHRWLKDYLESGFRGLVDDYARCGGKGRPRINTTVDQIIEDVITEQFTKLPRISELTGAVVHHEVCLRIEEINAAGTEDKLDKPSQSTVDRRLSAQKTQQTVRRSSSYQVGRFEEPMLPLENVEIDSTPMDVIVVDPVDNLPLGHPQITFGIDVLTRCPFGIYVGFEPSSVYAIMECLYHGILKKENTRENFGTAHEWQSYGLPVNLTTDNGKAFIGKDLSAACPTLGINLSHASLGNPKGKPHIERIFGTLNMQLFHLAPGTTFSNILDRGDYNSSSHAYLYLDDFTSAINLQLLDIYAEELHNGIDDIPARRWERYVSGGFIPRLPDSLHELEILLGRIVKRQVRHSGIELFNLHYNDPELGRLRVQLDGRAADIKYHPGDLSRIHVYDEFESRWICVFALDQAYTRNRSLWQHRLICEHARKLRGQVDVEGIALAVRQIQEIFDSGRDRRRKGRWDTSGKSVVHPAGSQGALGNPRSSVNPQSEDSDSTPSTVSIQQLLHQNATRAEASMSNSVTHPPGYVTPDNVHVEEDNIDLQDSALKQILSENVNRADQWLADDLR